MRYFSRNFTNKLKKKYQYDKMISILKKCGIGDTMKYLINKTNHCDFKTIAVNRLDPRAYFIAHSKRLNANQIDFSYEL